MSVQDLRLWYQAIDRYMNLIRSRKIPFVWNQNIKHSVDYIIDRLHHEKSQCQGYKSSERTCYHTLVGCWHHHLQCNGNNRHLVYCIHLAAPAMNGWDAAEWCWCLFIVFISFLEWSWTRNLLVPPFHLSYVIVSTFIAHLGMSTIFRCVNRKIMGDFIDSLIHFDTCSAWRWEFANGFL